MDIKKELEKLWNGKKGDYQKLTHIQFNEVGMRGIKDFDVADFRSG